MDPPLPAAHGPGAGSDHLVQAVQRRGRQPAGGRARAPQPALDRDAQLPVAFAYSQKRMTARVPPKPTVWLRPHPAIGTSLNSVVCRRHDSQNGSASAAPAVTRARSVFAMAPFASWASPWRNSDAKAPTVMSCPKVYPPESNPVTRGEKVCSTLAAVRALRCETHPAADTKPVPTISSTATPRLPSNDP